MNLGYEGEAVAGCEEESLRERRPDAGASECRELLLERV